MSSQCPMSVQNILYYTNCASSLSLSCFGVLHPKAFSESACVCVCVRERERCVADYPPPPPNTHTHTHTHQVHNSCCPTFIGYRTMAVQHQTKVTCTDSPHLHSIQNKKKHSRKALNTSIHGNSFRALLIMLVCCNCTPKEDTPSPHPPFNG